MSWETLTVGSLRFKKDVKEEEKTKILEDFETELECRIVWNERWKEYEFKDINWSSHVSADKIWKVFKKWRHKLDYFDFSLWYLQESDEQIFYDRESGELRVNLL
ncbi:hypothetical protein DRN73_05300 [Candidatus Pacearchaeota archaeon]|nr:MAG: hypothetical protein DRN73_05300 [Candidatus Pacearchaeota archaeon]